MVAPIGHGLHQAEAHEHHGDPRHHGGTGLAGRLHSTGAAAGKDLGNHPPHGKGECRHRDHPGEEADERTEDDPQDHEDGDSSGKDGVAAYGRPAGANKSHAATLATRGAGFRTLDQPLPRAAAQRVVRRDGRLSRP